ncbi:MAG: choline/carnitine O-acyltransferase [Chloroflexota bacterium]|nr:choline/carnitine O-acyltransferase [Chloroflexota bacterium]
MDPYERSQDIYEQIEGYAKPPLIPLPEPNDLRTLEYMGLKPSRSAHGIMKAAMAVSGFNTFQKELPENLEELLRHSNLRCGGLFAAIHSASLALEDDARNLTPIQRAATLLFGASTLHDDIWSASFPPDLYKDQILEMGQYPNLFSTSLVVEGPLARIYKSKNVSQITVLIDGRIFILETGGLGKETDIELLIETLEGLREQIVHHPRPGDLPPVGILSCADHPTTVQIFDALNRSETNRASFNMLRHSYLTLCLDLDSFPETHAEAARMAQSENNENRWHHASFQIVVFGNAKACTLFNFNAYLDGNTMMRSGAEVQKRAASYPLISENLKSSNNLILVKELPWEIPDEFIQKARQDINGVLDTQQATFKFEGIGTETFNKYNVPAVPVFILALQMTADEIVGRTTSMLQMMTMTRYRCMDLTSASISTPEVTRFVAAMEETDIDRQQARQLLTEAVESQIQRARDARQHLSYDKILGLFIFTRQGFKGALSRIVMVISGVLLRLLKLTTLWDVDIIVSHPAIYPQIPVVGRPGIRLPYVRYFALHYQIMHDKTVITMMPAVGWEVTNEEFITKLKSNLERVIGILQSEGDEK